MDKDNLAGVREHLLCLCSRIEVVLRGCEGETTRLEGVADAGIERE